METDVRGENKESLKENCPDDNRAKYDMNPLRVLEALASEYPQLFLNPDTDTIETYRGIVLKGHDPKKKSLSRYIGDKYDRDEIIDTPAGPVRVVTLGNRRDFELVYRGLAAAKYGPLAPVPESTGASMFTVFNWPRIKAHLAAFPEEQQGEEFKRFISVKSNYVDMLVVLSRGPYSHVDGTAVGHDETEWLAISDTIRRYHELTHVICRRLYPDDIDAVRDELVADAVGLYAAYGCFDPEKEKIFLGLRDGQYVGGRLENYTEEAEKLAGRICAELDRMKEQIELQSPENPFDLIPLLMQ